MAPRPVRQLGQTDLFGRALGAPDGFSYRPDFIDRAEEAALLAHMPALDFKAFQFHGFEGRRRVVYYGWRYDFTAGKIDRVEPIPDWLVPLRDAAARFAGLSPRALEHVLINEYQPGAPIGWHRDRPQFEEVLGVSLGAAAQFRMRLKLEDRPGWTRWSTEVAPRSLYRLSGPARWAWEHSIPPAPALRYSITFRSLRNQPAKPNPSYSIDE